MVRPNSYVSIKVLEYHKVNVSIQQGHRDSDSLNYPVAADEFVHLVALGRWELVSCARRVPWLDLYSKLASLYSVAKVGPIINTYDCKLSI